ncbi:WXG100 family type VII secretion target [Actinoplanes sp. RD1]|uniref:WXG100 family type VII secretion target n=1 Tax=Actinoplanes sp. RD1 TaxID=3064538 RepID=UPI002740CA96|nr:type VII secretion target [Actinoplanes sp. RD1]
MSFHVDPAALRTAASKIGDADRVAELAREYVTRHGTFSFHEQGLIGELAPGHRNLMSDLERMLTHLGKLSDESKTALRQAADGYEHTDSDNAARLDASYPPVPRPHPERD